MERLVMNLKIGIVGLPNVGKSTLFNALTNAGALAANYPFATIEPSVAVNHAGTIITKEPIIFGEEGYIEFDDDSSPNFLGDEMSVEEFLNTDFSQDEDESQTMGGMRL